MGVGCVWNTDLLSGLLVLGITFAAWIQSRDFSYYGGVFVNWVLVVLAVLGAVLVIKGVKNRKAAERIQFTKPQLKRLFALAGLLIAYLLLIYGVGFVLGSMIAYTAICLMLFSPERRFTVRAWAESFGAGILVTVLFYIVFKYALLVPLPVGVLFG